MSAYVILFRESPVRDPEAMRKYRESPRPPELFEKMKVRVAYGAQIAIEGEPPDGVIVLEFPTMEDAKAWYYSPDYQKAAVFRLQAADFRGVIVEGFEPPA